MKSRRILVLSFLSVILSLALVSCEKEEAPDNHIPADSTPIVNPPTEGNYVVCGADSLGVQIVVAMRSAYKGDVIDWSIKLSDAQILKLYTGNDLLQGGTYSFVTESAAYSLADGVYGVYMEGFEEEDIAQGTITVRMVLGNPEMTIQATTNSGRNVRMHYWGIVHNLTHPLGEGELQYGTTMKNLDIAYSQIYYDLYEYAFADTLSSFGVTFYSVNPFASGTFTLTDDMDQVEQGQALDLWLDLEGSTLMGDVTNGTATITLTDGEISITFSGELDGMPVSGSYSGKIEDLGEGVL